MFIQGNILQKVHTAKNCSGCHDVGVLVWEYSVLQLLFAIMVLHLMYNILLKKMIRQ